MNTKSIMKVIYAQSRRQLVAIGLLGSFMLRCVYIAISAYESNLDAFDWLYKSNQPKALFMYWGFLAALLLICVELFAFIMKDEKKICTCGIQLFLVVGLVKLGRICFSDWNNSDNSIILYRLFCTYYKVIQLGLVVSLLLIIIGVIVLKEAKE